MFEAVAAKIRATPCFVPKPPDLVSASREATSVAALETKAAAMLATERFAVAKSVAAKASAMATEACFTAVAAVKAAVAAVAAASLATATTATTPFAQKRPGEDSRRTCTPDNLCMAMCRD